MANDWLGPLTNPAMRLVWAIAGIIVILLILVNKSAPDPIARRAQGIQQLVFEATAIRPSSCGFVLWQVVAWLVPLLCLGSGMLLQIRSISAGRGPGVAGWVLIAAFLSSAILLANARVRGLHWVQRKLSCADYDGALARADLLIRWFPGTPLVHFMRGTVLLFAGRLPEAEESLRTAVAKSLARAGGMMIGGLGNLGCVLLHQKRFREATAALEAITKTYPRFFGAHSSLAEVLLAQGLEPQRVLLLIDNALKLKQGNPRTRNLDRHETAYMWANRALALAMLGRMDEAASAVAAAEREVDPRFIPGLAGAAWRCGLALARMDKPSAAAEQFRKAAQIDPHGLYGKLAVAELHAGVALIE